jgi:hypothetical protein
MDKRRELSRCSNVDGSSAVSRSDSWIDDELAECRFHDERHRKRFHKLLQQLTSGVGSSIPWMCQDWANTKAAYRFFSNNHVSEAEILAGHFRSTHDRFASRPGTTLVLHDTTEFVYHREDMAAVGLLTHSITSRDNSGRRRQYTVCGISMHSSLAVTLEGLPLGLTAIKFWTRDKFQGCSALKRHINPTRVPIEKKESVRWLQNLRQSTVLLGEPDRCVHIGDRESDIYELFCAANELGTHFLVRTCVDRLAWDGSGTVADEIERIPIKGLHRVQVRNQKGEWSEAVLQLKYCRLILRPPIGKEKRYPTLIVTVIHATERGTPHGRERIEWKLLTDLPVHSRREAIEKIDWYAMRWKIETFHKILKSGCKAEESKLRTAERLVNLLAVLCIVSWRIFWMTMLNRTASNGPAELVFTKLELRLLDALVKSSTVSRTHFISAYVTKLAKLGGYLARSSDPPPGNMVVWRGMSRLIDIELGATLARQVVGN